MVFAGWAIACLISLSRIYIADHWPLDVVCGAVLGFVCGVAAVAGYRAWAASMRHRSPTQESEGLKDNTVSTGPQAT
jgi:membrane-associated phospholipid phosphatase